jgi:alkanesulfonate monooxygenase
MEIGLALSNFTWPGGPDQLASDFARTARLAEDVGFSKLSVMDHLWQIPSIGPAEHEMLEAYTALGFLAACTERVELLAFVTAATYRDPGLLAKAVTTLDVLSHGRAWLGIGAGWNEQESAGLGLFFPPRAERFERLEEAIQICLQMWAEDDAPFHGKHYTLERTLNSPQSVRRPHPPIMVGGAGEKKTLRLVAKYAQACNLFASPELQHKLDVLRQHCADVGRDYDEIQKSVLVPLQDPGPTGEHVDEILERLRGLASLGITYVHTGVPDLSAARPLELFGERIIPEAAKF